MTITPFSPDDFERARRADRKAALRRDWRDEDAGPPTVEMLDEEARRWERLCLAEDGT